MEIRAEKLCKAYHGTPVLQNVTFTAREGVTCVMAPSGTGKTTLLRLLLGLEKPDSGSLTHCRWSAVFQEDRLCEDYSAGKNVEMVLGNAESAAAALLKVLPAESLQKPCRELSGGMKRRVALVRAMEAKSKVILLDEPFTGMDAETRRQAEEYIRERQNVSSSS